MEGTGEKSCAKGGRDFYSHPHKLLVALFIDRHIFDGHRKML